MANTLLLLPLKLRFDADIMPFTVSLAVNGSYAELFIYTAKREQLRPHNVHMLGEGEGMMATRRVARGLLLAFVV